MSTLILGYGNPGRQDDGLGPAVANAIDQLGLPNVTAYDNYQLNIEDALEVADHDVVWFVDASTAGAAPYAVSVLAAVAKVEFTSHIMHPQTILAIAQQCYGKAPAAVSIGHPRLRIRVRRGADAGRGREPGRRVSHADGHHRPVAGMNIGLGDKRRTVLLIDSDPHARAALRIALEGAGFSVGEAANEQEGERTALRVKPDAILAELMMDAHGTLSERLRATGSTIPCYIVSTASEALMGSVGLHELGIEGVFLKPRRRRNRNPDAQGPAGCMRSPLLKASSTSSSPNVKSKFSPGCA